MSIRLSQSRYGESGVRLVNLARRGDRHEVKDLRVSVALEGDFTDAHQTGDNRRILAEDALRNTVYALASRHGGGEIEEFALALSHHFMLEDDTLARVEVTVHEQRWSRIAIGGRPHGQAFSQGGGETRVTTVRRTGGDVVVEAGIQDLSILKTTASGFTGYMRDRYTLDEGPRLRVALLDARWRYGWTSIPFGVHWQQVRELILETFAEHDGRSAQHTLYALAQAALEQCPPLAEIRLRLATRAHPLVDLTPFGLTNEDEVFAVAEEPFAVLEATVRREEG